MAGWKYSISSADAAPSSAPILLQGSVCENLKKAAKLGYDAIEIHTREDARLNYEEINNCVKDTGVRVGMVVTGRLNTQGRCSLIDDAPYVTAAAIEGLKQYIDMAARLSADVVIGWVRGKIPEGGSRQFYLERLARNMGVLADYAEGHGVKLNIEVINRYEVNLFTTAKETIEFIEGSNLKNCYIHLDTFHMFIDEKNPFDAIRACKSKLGYFHLADHSRQYPGSGFMDFNKILQTLKEIEYDGLLGVECLPIPNAEEAAKNAIEHMKMLEKTNGF